MWTVELVIFAADLLQETANTEAFTHAIGRGFYIFDAKRFF